MKIQLIFLNAGINPSIKISENLLKPSETWRLSNFVVETSENHMLKLLDAFVKNANYF
jgi:hypothetical protein